MIQVSIAPADAEIPCKPGQFRQPRPCGWRGRRRYGAAI